MNQTKETGGPAFPTKRLIERDMDGMTMRDYFAAKAMQADMEDGIHEADFLEYACRAYKMADAMLEARK
jgi:hypothetical protein